MAGRNPPPTMADEEEMAIEKNAALVMGTNNSSIVSKRSVEKLYLPEPHFYRYFVRKPQRRSPIINRGYWLRMRAVDWVIRRFLEKSPDQRKVIINLGCGYDPIPFQCMSRDRELCKLTKFVDVDYDDLMLRKREVILNTPKLRVFLTLKEDEPARDSVIIDSDEYAALGCDLRNLKKLDRLVKSVTRVEDCLILCVGEVSLAYMSVKDSNAVIAWSQTLSPDVTFCLLEQGCPDRPDNPFTTTMLKHFTKLGTPLRTVLTYPGDHSQKYRFTDAGYASVEVQTLWQLWSDPRFLTPSQRMGLDHIEPFDEWEEFALFASHYNLVIAHNVFEPLMPENERGRRKSMDSIASDLSTRTVSPWRDDKQYFAWDFVKNVNQEGRTHHASAYLLPEHDAIAVFGGVGQQSRLATTSVYSSSTLAELADKTPVLPPSKIGARCCHTITTLGNGQNILIGGRASPSAPMKDCWLQTGNEWHRIEDLPEPRYRHRTVAVTFPNNSFGVLVFGGKSSATTVVSDIVMWDARRGWRKLRSAFQDPMPRFGASFIRLGHNHGLLFGGMRQDGVVCQGLWRWRLISKNHDVDCISFRQSTALDTSAGSYPWIGRLGASYSILRDELLIIGGIAKNGCIPKGYEILSMLGSFSSFSENEHEMEMRVLCVDPKIEPNTPRPFLVGHSTHRAVWDLTLIAGGGATCFSFGTYWNPGVWLLRHRQTEVGPPWRLVKLPQIKAADAPPTTKSVTIEPGSVFHSPCSVLRRNIRTTADFRSILFAAQPVILTDLDLGPCLELWNPSYLKSKINPDRKVIVHAAPTRYMNFQRKDSFTYTTLSFHAFLTILTSAPQDAHMYLRSISSQSPNQSPANFALDWPEIAQDFAIPPQFKFIEQNLHSSPLRISGNVNMWLHYDVMANVLFQVRGMRKLVLYPPSDITYLSFPPGSTTSILDVFEPGIDSKQATTPKAGIPDQQHNHESVAGDRIRPILNTHPYIAILKPGDALFIPPLWSHAATAISHDPSIDTNTKQNGESQTNLSLNRTPSIALSTKSSSTITDSIPPTTPKAISFSIPPTSSPIAETPTSIHPRSSPIPSPDPATKHISIAINVFFRNLQNQKYAAGRDVYGNRDLAAYEEGRRDIDKIVKRFGLLNSSSATGSGTVEPKTEGHDSAGTQTEQNGKNHDRPDANATKHAETPELEMGIPKVMAKAYLERLADELRMRAREL